MSDYILGASGSMDIAHFLESQGSYPQEIQDELVFVSKEWITDLMNATGAILTEWKFEGTQLQAVLEAHVDVFEIWRTYKRLMRATLNYKFPEDNALQQQISKILELMPKERDD